MHSVQIYFDVVSPYSYLALTQVDTFGDHHGVVWEARPVVYGALLDATGLVGPAESEVKRRYTFLDILRVATNLEVPLVGPPAHPFRSLEAQRVVCLFARTPEALPLAVALARACWGEGRDVTDPSVLCDIVAGVGLDARDLADRLRTVEVKRSLRRFTEEALAAGVFGVPTFRFGEELFWGHDRLHHLAARLQGEAPPADAAVAMLRERPRGADRRVVRRRRDDAAE